MLASAQISAGEAVAKFNPFYRVNTEHRMAQSGMEFIKNGLT